jgi:hypothetical protein
MMGSRTVIRVWQWQQYLQLKLPPQ